MSGMDKANVTRASATSGSCRVSLALAIALALSMGAPGQVPPFGQEATPTTAAQPSNPVRLSGFADKGTFRFYLNEEVLVTQDFTWEEDGFYRGEYTLSLAGQSVTTTLAIATGPDGHWTGVKMETPRGPAELVREGDLVRITHNGDLSTMTLRPGTVLFENFNPALMSLAVRTYDAETGGKQTLPILIIPNALMDGSLERLDTVERTVAGRDVRLTRYTYGLPGVDVILYVDENDRIVFGDVPAQHGAYVREGYEALRRPSEPDPLLSRPQYEVEIEKNVGVPMRDGLHLATDIYRPQREGRHPVILARTPYKKELNELQGRYFARRGYVYAVQDCRGRFSSPGEWVPFFNEARDGYDTVEWLARQRWSSGKVGMIGASYLGWVQWWAARDRPPHLTTIIPSVSPPDPYFNIPYENGVFFLLGAIWWADILESEATGDISGKTFMEIGRKEYARLLRHLPVIELDEKVLGKVNPYWRSWIAHPDNDAFWEPASFLDHLEPLEIPVFHQSGWFDGDGIGSKLNYLAMASHGHPHQKLVLGPWGHTDRATRRIGERDFGEEAIVDLEREYLRWFDRWLKGVENGMDKEPLVSIFVMGANKWLHAGSYPLPQTRMTKYYLTSRGRANTSNGDGRLGPERPAPDAPPDRFTYDPGDPTPSPSYYVSPEIVHDDHEEDGQPTVRSFEEDRRKRRDYYRKVNQERADILVYETPPLQEPLTVAGPIAATLYASTSAGDTDWFMRLSEIGPEGAVFPLTQGKIRARYRKSFTQPELLEPGRVYEYHLDLWQTGIRIPAGSRLRVEVASASFPLFSRNLNTGGHSEVETDYVVAQQTVYHDPRYPSHVILPVIPSAE